MRRPVASSPADAGSCSSPSRSSLPRSGFPAPDARRGGNAAQVGPSVSRRRRCSCHACAGGFGEGAWWPGGRLNCALIVSARAQCKLDGVSIRLAADLAQGERVAARSGGRAATPLGEPVACTPWLEPQHAIHTPSGARPTAPRDFAGPSCSEAASPVPPCPAGGPRQPSTQPFPHRPRSRESLGHHGLHYRPSQERSTACAWLAGQPCSRVPVPDSQLLPQIPLTARAWAASWELPVASPAEA